MVACTLDYHWARYVIAALISLFGGVVVLLPVKITLYVRERSGRGRRRSSTPSKFQSSLCRLQSAAEYLLAGTSATNKIIVSSLHSAELFMKALCFLLLW